MNHKIHDCYQESKFSVYVKLMRMRWVVNVQRTQDIRVAKRMRTERLVDKRQVGKLKLRLEDLIRSGTEEVLGAKTWKDASRYRDVWRRKETEEARVRYGL